jgi:hypothetical protein
MAGIKNRKRIQVLLGKNEILWKILICRIPSANAYMLIYSLKSEAIDIPQAKDELISQIKDESKSVIEQVK